MSALRRLLSIAALATQSREASPAEAAGIAARDESYALSPPEIQPLPDRADDNSATKDTKPE